MKKQILFILIICLFIKYLVGPIFAQTYTKAKQYHELITLYRDLNKLQNENRALHNEYELQTTLRINNIKSTLYKIFKKNGCKLISENTIENISKKSSKQEIELAYHLQGSYPLISRTITSILNKDLPVYYKKMRIQANQSGQIDVFFTLYALSIEQQLL